MNDYKELITALREEAEAVKAVEWDIPICTANHILEAADAIERLQQERDAAVKDISLPIIGNSFTDHCKICKHRFEEDPCLCLECNEVTQNGNFEWRGIADDD